MALKNVHITLFLAVVIPMIATAENSIEKDSNPFTSARINLEQKVFFIYGKIEPYIKMPVTANGLCPTFFAR